MIKTLAAIAALAAGLSSSYAGVDFDQNINIKNILASDTLKDAEVPAAKAVHHRPEQKNWTIMVFVNGKNNLESYALKDVNEMEMVGSSKDLNIVVELGRMEGYSTDEGDWTGSRRYLIQKDDNPKAVTSPVIENIKSADMGDYKHLVEFINWTKANFPAKKYMLVIWNHGSGWDKKGPSKGISYDDETNNHITTQQMAQALAETGGADVIGTDACLMQMMEVDHEIAKYVTYIVGSEETEPGDGYTYNDFLAKIIGNPDPTPLEVGTAAVDAYTDHYVGINQSATQSLVKASEVGGLNKLLDQWTALVRALPNGKKICQDMSEQTITFASYTGKDLYNFIELVGLNTTDPAVKAKGEEIMKYISEKLVVHNRAAGDLYEKNAHGIAIYLPSYYVSPEYSALAFARDTNWDEFVTWLNTNVSSNTK